jgi:glycosyltransferase involved in cell wall biosynthesis/ADP-heptose:LPS heptosyltransferase
MRIVIDMQGAQTESRFRGIGRYSLSLALAIARQRGEHEIILVLNGMFPHTIEPIRSAFYGLLPQENIVIWDGVAPVREADIGNHTRREVSEVLREAFILAQRPDLLLITSLFEGFGDDAVTSVGRFESSIPTAVILYDLIPLINPDERLASNSPQRDYYYRKIASLKKSQLLLAISDRARLEAMTALKFAPDNVINVSGAFDDVFKVIDLSPDDKTTLLSRLNIQKPFVFYTGGADARKNLHRLIEAYANLPTRLRSQHQLVLAGKMPIGHIEDFQATATRCGLSEGEMLLLGYVQDEDLLKLYNLCHLFIFPSLHEGFGIPPLEAMSCGAPVIGARATSLPEVIGLSEALFDPLSVKSIATKLEQALTDETFRMRLITHGLQHAKTFTWAASAQRALVAFERFQPRAPAPSVSGIAIEKTTLFDSAPKKILLLKLDHLGDFVLAIPAISRLKARYPNAAIDLVVGSWSVPLAQGLKLFNNIFGFDYFKKKSSEAAVVSERALQDLFAQLGEYDFAVDLRRQRDTRFILSEVRAQFKVGYETFDPLLDSHLDVALAAQPELVSQVTAQNEVSSSIQMMRLVDALPDSISDYLSFPPLVEKSKPTDTRIAVLPRAGNAVKEWSQQNFADLVERLVARPEVDGVNIYFANREEALEFVLPVHSKVQVHAGLEMPALLSSLADNVLCVANNSFGAHVAGYLGLVVLGIYGGHETVAEWAPVYKDSYVIYHPVTCSPCHIAKVSDCPYGLKCLTEITVEAVYQKVTEAIALILDRRTAARPTSALQLAEQSGELTFSQVLMQTLAGVGLKALELKDKMSLAQAMTHNHPKPAARQLFVDISELVQHDAKTGIQRVVRSVLRAMLERTLPGYAVVPVYATLESAGYRKAMSFTQDFMGSRHNPSHGDEPIVYRAGDVFLGLDLHPHIVYAQREVLARMRARGVQVHFVVYDLLCETLPHHFVPNSQEPFVRWLTIVSQSDGAMCISKDVADGLRNWVAQQGLENTRHFAIKHFNLGADLVGSVSSSGISEQEQRFLHGLEGQLTFLMVGTLEPRKAHAQALAAFEQLWSTQQAVNLVIIGKKGWLVDALVKRLQQHPQQGKKLFWFQGVSDEFLQKIYATSSCLLLPSEGEGFGLPLIEAAQYNLPIIARDLPVFKEVAGQYAYYFSGSDPVDLSHAIEAWLQLYQVGKHPASGEMPRLTWQQSTAKLLDALLQ